MLEHTPTDQELTALVGEPLFEAWAALCSAIDERCDMNRQWASDGKWVRLEPSDTSLFEGFRRPLSPFAGKRHP